VLPTPPLPVITTSSRWSSDCMVVGVCLKPEPPGCTYNRAMSNAGHEFIDQEVEFDREGLVPCVVQDWSTGEVLTLAYMNEQALQLTRDTGELHLWSRSRAEQ